MHASVCDGICNYGFHARVADSVWTSPGGFAALLLVAYVVFELIRALLTVWRLITNGAPNGNVR